MSHSSPRRSGGVVPLLVVIVIAAVLWFVFARPQGATLPGVDPTATIDTASDNPAPSPSDRQETPAVAVEDSSAAVDAPAAEAAPVSSSQETPDDEGPEATATRGPPDAIDGLPVITRDELPPEALETLDLIEAGGPFPFSKDGTTFQNREALLPDRPRGYYSEYTVITPGEDDRGARRIVAGDNGELYYTDDHYESFYVIWLP